MTRLIHLTDYANRHRGSYIPWLVAVLEAGKREGWQVAASFPDDVGDAEWIHDFTSRDITVHLLPRVSRRARVPQVRELLGDDPAPTIVHSHFTKYDIPAVLAARGRASTVAYWHIHTVLDDSPASIARNAGKMILFGGSVDRIVVPASNIGDALVKRRAPREKILLLPSTIDPEEFRPPTIEQRAAARAELQIPDDRFALLHIGRAWELKGGPSFLGAVKILRDQGVPVVGVTLRGGEEAKRESSELGLGDAVRVPERVADIRSLYRLADCFVAPSEGEGMPFSIVEALSSGIPVVASDLPGHRYVADEVAACVIATREPAGLAAAIRKILERPADRARDEGDAARRWIVENLSLDSAIKMLFDAYGESLGNSDLT